MAGKTNSGFEDEKGGAQGGGLLGVDNSALNSHTYVYDADKSLRKMTIEALPSPENYQVSRRQERFYVRSEAEMECFCSLHTHRTGTHFLSRTSWSHFHFGKYSIFSHLHLSDF